MILLEERRRVVRRWKQARKRSSLISYYGESNSRRTTNKKDNPRLQLLTPSRASFRISICLLFQRIIASGNAIPYGIQSSQLYGFGSSINAATNIETAIQVKMETRIMKARSRGPEVFLIEK
ncbi:MAG: hypothetical protein DME45_05685 [Verrucomicrobia bacterium]|nr:MAG: hypothetical protein DME45_05685 [Verrucomicrobiota bacterium]